MVDTPECMVSRLSAHSQPVSHLPAASENKTPVFSQVDLAFCWASFCSYQLMHIWRVRHKRCTCRVDVIGPAGSFMVGEVTQTQNVTKLQPGSVASVLEEHWFLSETCFIVWWSYWEYRDTIPCSLLSYNHVDGYHITTAASLSWLLQCMW